MVGKHTDMLLDEICVTTLMIDTAKTNKLFM